MRGKERYWGIKSSLPEPLIVIANSSDGRWVHKLAPKDVPAPYVDFHYVREGIFGPIIRPASLVLLRDDVLMALRKLSTVEFAANRARIRQVKSDETVDNYSVIKISRHTPLASFTTPAGYPNLHNIDETIDAILDSNQLLISNELRILLEACHIPNLAFYDSARWRSTRQSIERIRPPPTVHGRAPNLVGVTLDDMICTQYWRAGEFDDAATSIYVRLRGSWYSFSLDFGEVFWSTSAVAVPYYPGPATDDSPFVNLNLGEELGIAGRIICSCVAEPFGEYDVKVSFHFDGGGYVSFVCVGQNTSIEHSGLNDRGT